MLQPLFDTDAEIVASYRHQQLDVSVPQSGAPPRMLRVLDSLVRPVSGAQVFAVDDIGPRGSAVVRFLGFTSQLGVAPLQAVAEDGSVVVVGAHGTVATVANPRAEPMTANTTLQANARVSLHTSLRPSPPRLMPLRFERLDSGIAGMSPVAVRFVCEANNWEIGDLPPGAYKVTIVGDTATPPFEETIDLVPGGFVVVQ